MSRNTILVLIVLIIVFSTSAAWAQQPQTAVEYMEFLSGQETTLSKKYLSYMSEVAHGNRARKMERRRQEVVAAIRQALNAAGKLKPYQGDASLRDAYKKYWDLLLKVYNEDYHKIVDMEEIAEQSYDKMEAYLLAKERAGDVLNQAQDEMILAFQTFAVNNNVKLIDTDSRLSRKLRQVGDASRYYNAVFLVFFKSFKQEVYMIDAYTRKDVNALEQNRMALKQVAEEGLARLDTIRPYKGDGSLVNVCRKVLSFHKNESQQIVPSMVNFLVEDAEFEKLRKAMEAKKDRTQTDIDQYNAAVSAFNKSVQMANKQMTDTSETRNKLLSGWDTAGNQFMQHHVPHD